MAMFLHILTDIILPILVLALVGFVALIVGFFVVSGLYVRFCDKL